MKKRVMLVLCIVMLAAVTAIAGMAVMDDTDLTEVTGQEGLTLMSWIGRAEGTIFITDKDGVATSPAYTNPATINWSGVYIDDGRGINVEFSNWTFDIGTQSGNSIFYYGIPDVDGELYFSDIFIGTTVGTGRRDESTWEFGNYFWRDGSVLMMFGHTN